MALTIATGFVVDDAHRDGRRKHFHGIWNGALPPLQAAPEGRPKEVGFTIVSMSISLIRRYLFRCS